MCGRSVFVIEWGREVPCRTSAPCLVFLGVVSGFMEGRTGSLSRFSSFSMRHSILAKNIFLPECIGYGYGEQVGAHQVTL